MSALGRQWLSQRRVRPRPMAALSSLTTRSPSKGGGFLSIRTNDRSQYTPAVDRTHHTLADLGSTADLAVRRFSALELEVVRRHEIEVRPWDTMGDEPFDTTLLLGHGPKTIEHAVFRADRPSIRGLIRGLRRKVSRQPQTSGFGASSFYLPSPIPNRLMAARWSEVARNRPPRNGPPS
jgi:hypothetical protein